MITAATAGAYLGYTKGGSEPTLYFANGHYTQVHKEDANVGWHPRRGGEYRASNIKQGAVDEIMSIGVGSAKEEEFVRKFRTGIFDQPDGPNLFEVWKVNGKTETHISRGRLITNGMPGFADVTPQQVAAVLQNGVVAPNEHGA